MHVGVFLIQGASFIHLASDSMFCIDFVRVTNCFYDYDYDLVCRCASLSTTFALSQSMTWFSSKA